MRGGASAVRPKPGEKTHFFRETTGRVFEKAASKRNYCTNFAFLWGGGEPRALGSPHGKSALGKGWGAWGEGEPLQRRQRPDGRPLGRAR